MSQLTEHFNSVEFMCKDGCLVPADLMANVKRLAEQLEILRGKAGAPVAIISGYRTPTHNEGVKGKPKSRHLTAEAADIRIKGRPPIDVYNLIEYLISHGVMHNGGLGLYPPRKARKFPPRKARLGFVHYDVRAKPARWRG